MQGMTFGAMWRAPVLQAIFFMTNTIWCAFSAQDVVDRLASVERLTSLMTHAVEAHVRVNAKVMADASRAYAAELRELGDTVKYCQRTTTCGAGCWVTDTGSTCAGKYLVKQADVEEYIKKDKSIPKTAKFCDAGCYVCGGPLVASC